MIFRLIMELPAQHLQDSGSGLTKEDRKIDAPDPVKGKPCFIIVYAYLDVIPPTVFITLTHSDPQSPPSCSQV